MFSKAFIDGYENRPTRYSDFGNSEYSKEWENGCIARSIHLQIAYGIGPIENELSIENFDENNRKTIQFLQKLEEISFVNKLSVPITDEQVSQNLKWVESLKSD